MPKGYMYLTAVRDWYSKYVLSWELSNTMDVEFCLKSLRNALKHGVPEIFNTDQGSQYTSQIFTQTLLDNNIKISMDGVGRATDNICIERFWRDVKYECVYIYKPNTVVELYKQIKEYINFYNNHRPHQTLLYAVPSDVFNKNVSFQQRKKEAKKEINNINNNINLYNCSSSYS
jgi:putative transposase